MASGESWRCGGKTLSWDPGHEDAPSRETSMKTRGGASFPPDNEPLSESEASMPESLGNVVKQSNAEK